MFMPADLEANLLSCLMPMLVFSKSSLPEPERREVVAAAKQ